MATVGQGDVVIIPAVDRLSRHTTDLPTIARDLLKVGAGLRSIAEPIADTTSGHAENLNVYLAPGSRFRLAPLYDVMSA
jgi:DNA invertase Pin-like site-specific DNA recombinase